VGSESGSECTDCAKSIFVDDFSGPLSSSGWQPSAGGCVANGMHPLYGAHTSGGVLIGGSGSAIVQSFPRPALAGFCVEVKIKLVTLGSTNGIALAHGPFFFFRNGFGNYGRQLFCDQYGCYTSPMSFAAFGPVPAIGDTMSFTIRDQGAADGVCTICYKVNGTTVRVEENVQFCFPCTMIASILTWPSNGQYDDFEIRSS
jgi:hypothetical protein